MVSPHHKFDDMLCETIVPRDGFEKTCLGVPRYRGCRKSHSAVKMPFAWAAEESCCPDCISESVSIKESEDCLYELER